mmetsp:Transcript_34313/g.96709  ORF Transcript_34313/g.96709 Transcript_34313/m.96709 type:complete len:306 (+) Transcript_34313:781-1698(+)
MSFATFVPQASRRSGRGDCPSLSVMAQSAPASSSMPTSRATSSRSSELSSSASEHTFVRAVCPSLFLALTAASPEASTVRTMSTTLSSLETAVSSTVSPSSSCKERNSPGGPIFSTIAFQSSTSPSAAGATSRVSTPSERALRSCSAVAFSVTTRRASANSPSSCSNRSDMTLAMGASVLPATGVNESAPARSSATKAFASSSPNFCRSASTCSGVRPSCSSSTAAPDFKSISTIPASVVGASPLPSARCSSGQPLMRAAFTNAARCSSVHFSSTASICSRGRLLFTSAARTLFLSAPRAMTSAP